MAELFLFFANDEVPLVTRLCSSPGQKPVPSGPSPTGRNPRALPAARPPSPNALGSRRPPARRAPQKTKKTSNGSRAPAASPNAMGGSNLHFHIHCEESAGAAGSGLPWAAAGQGARLRRTVGGVRGGGGTLAEMRPLSSESGSFFLHKNPQFFADANYQILAW